MLNRTKTAAETGSECRGDKADACSCETDCRPSSLTSDLLCHSDRKCAPLLAGNRLITSRFMGVSSIII